MLFFYVRHGDPIYNPDSLTPLGQRQAEAVGKRLEAKETAKAVETVEAELVEDSAESEAAEEAAEEEITD